MSCKLNHEFGRLRTLVLALCFLMQVAEAAQIASNVLCYESVLANDAHQ